MRKLAPVYTTARMVREYTETYYVTAGRRARSLAENDFARAKALIVWKEKLRSHWGDVRVESVTAEADKLSAGEKAPVKATITLGSVITPHDVTVQLYAGPVDADRNMVETNIASLTPESPAGSDGKYVYSGSLPSDKSGQLGFTVRVVPNHPDAVLPQELPLIAWE
jgi:starch phosphorylase